MQSAPKKAVKVSYQGETKRLKLSGVYSELVERTRSAFKNLPHQFKFFFLDEDNEIISVSSQSDYTEALEIEDIAALRLTVAQSPSDARQQLVNQLEDAKPLAESLNSSQIMSQFGGNAGGFGRQMTMQNNFMNAESDFDAISHAELGQSSLQRRNTMMAEPARQSHEIAVGSDAPLTQRQSVSTATATDVVHAEAGCNTARVQTSEKMIDTCVQMQDSSSQARTQVRDMGCDGIITQMQNQASQMDVQVKEVDVTCDLLIPSDDDQDGDVEEVACIKRNGTQMNKKGLPCRKCNGRGTLVSKELSAIANMVRFEVQEYCYKSFKEMFCDILEKRKVEQENTVHEKIICDGCGANPIRGIRYMCSVRADTDFCETCEKNGVSGEHPLLKIRKQSQAPAKLICQYKNSGFSAQAMAQAFMQSAEQQPRAQQPDVHPWERMAAPANNNNQRKDVRYSARFVKESFPDKKEVNCGDVFCKSWWMRNDGETSWPAGTQFLQTSGDNISAQVVTLKNEVKAGTTFEISVQAKAPEQEGRYTAFFRLQTGRIKFGHKVTCDILCVQPKEQVVHEDIYSELVAQPATVAKPEPVAMVAQEAFVEAADKEMAEPHPVKGQEEQEDLPMESPLMQSTISIDAKSPKQVYFEQVDAESDETLKASLKALYDFGFTDFGVNKMLMLKHNDVNVVANQLMTGALSESQFVNMLREE